MSCNTKGKQVSLDSFNGDFLEYDKFVKESFLTDFVINHAYRNGKRITAGKTDIEIEECYNHMTTKGSMDSSVRLPDLRRYESIFMLKDILTSDICFNCDNYISWEKEEKYLKEKIFCIDTGYLIILAKRNFVYKFVSAYHIDSKSKKEKLIEEYNKFKK